MAARTTVDPDNVPETLCSGIFNVSTSAAGLVTFTFTHVRPKAGPLLDANQIDEENVVRARIVTTIDNAHALRDVLDSLIKKQPTAPAAADAGSSTLN
jgi:hypothetical protein